MGFGVTQGGFQYLLMHFWGPESQEELLSFSEPQILHPPHRGGDDGSLTGLLDDMNYVQHRHSEMMGFLLHFPSDIKGSHEATVWALPSLMGSCSWLR